MSRLNDLIGQVAKTDPQLAKYLRQETDALADRRAFGLNFERHVPEAVELPGRPVRKNDKVRCLPERGTTPTKADERLYRVTDVYTEDGERKADIEALDDPDDQRSVYVAELVVVAEFGDPIYPGLVSTGKVERGGGTLGDPGDKPYHVVINAENFHALQALLFTHRGKVDCIYIDPPYNTGTEDWIYNDRYVAADDHYIHSKWLAFMERRLSIARELLSESGVVIVAIGDDEHHRLRMLLDQVFEPQNFIANLTWQGGGSFLARHHAGGVDYMLVYGKTAEKVTTLRDPKPHAPEMLMVVSDRLEGGGSATDAQEDLRKYIRANARTIASGLKGFSSVDDEGRVFDTADITNRLYRPNLKYPVTDPETGVVYQPPDNGWTVEPGVMQSWISAGLLVFGGRFPRKKKLLQDYMTEMPLPTFTKSRSAASGYLAEVLGSKRFPNPKDVDVLSRWLYMLAPRDGVILDFFGGSGSTAEAVFRLNMGDGGTRRAIVVTNNEVAAAEAKRLRKSGLRPGDTDWEARGVYEYVAMPRIETVLTGQRPDGSMFSDGLDQNVQFFRLTYESAMRVSSHREFAKVAPFLWLRAGSRGRRIDDVSSGWDVAEAYGVIANLDLSESFVEAVEAQESLTHAFVVTDDDRLFEAMVRQLPEHVEPVRLYSSYLRNFEIEAGRAAR